MVLSEICSEYAFIVKYGDNVQDMPDVFVSVHWSVDAHVCTQKEFDLGSLPDPFATQKISGRDIESSNPFHPNVDPIFYDASFDFKESPCDIGCLVWMYYTSRNTDDIKVAGKTKLAIDCVGEIDVRLEVDSAHMPATIVMTEDKHPGSFFAHLADVLYQVEVGLDFGASLLPVDGSLWPLSVVVFLRPQPWQETKDPIHGQSQCSQGFGNITIYDEALVHFTTSKKLTPKEPWLLDIGKTLIEMGGDRCPLCGNATLVVLFDPTGDFIGNDINVCNNYVSLPVFIECPATLKQASVVQVLSLATDLGSDPFIKICSGNSAPPKLVQYHANNNSWNPKTAKTLNLRDSLSLMRVQLMTRYFADEYLHDDSPCDPIKMDIAAMTEILEHSNTQETSSSLLSESLPVDIKDMVENITKRCFDEFVENHGEEHLQYVENIKLGCLTAAYLVVSNECPDMIKLYESLLDPMDIINALTGMMPDKAEVKEQMCLSKEDTDVPNIAELCGLSKLSRTLDGSQHIAMKVAVDIRKDLKENGLHSWLLWKNLEKILPFLDWTNMMDYPKSCVPPDPFQIRLDIPRYYTVHNGTLLVGIGENPQDPGGDIDICWKTIAMFRCPHCINDDDVIAFQEQWEAVMNNEL